MKHDEKYCQKMFNDCPKKVFEILLCDKNQKSLVYFTIPEMTNSYKMVKGKLMINIRPDPRS